MKWILRIVLILVVLVLVAGASIWFLKDSIIKDVIEDAGTKELTVDVTAAGTRLQLFSGKLGITELAIANPEGFDSPFLLSVGNTDIAVNTGSLLGSPKEIEYIRLDTIDVFIEGDVQATNIHKLMQMRQDAQQTGPEESEPEPQSEESGPTLAIREITLTNITARVNTNLIQNTVKIEEIKVPITEQGTINTAELIELVTLIVLEKSIAQFPQLIPNLMGAVSDQLGSAMQGVGDVMEGGAEVIGEITEGAGEAVKQVTEGAGQAVQDAAEGATEGAGQAVDDAVDNIGEGLGNLFGGGDDNDSE